MPLHPSQYGHVIKDKLEAEAVATNRAGLDARLKKRAAEIEAEGTGDTGIADHPALKDPYEHWDASPAKRHIKTHKVETRDGSYVHIKSPAFPTIAEALARRQRDREHFAVRSMIAATVVAEGYSLIFGGSFGYVAGGFFFVGAIIAAAVTSRRHE